MTKSLLLWAITFVLAAPITVAALIVVNIVVKVHPFTGEEFPINSVGPPLAAIALVEFLSGVLLGIVACITGMVAESDRELQEEIDRRYKRRKQTS